MAHKQHAVSTDAPPRPKKKRRFWWRILLGFVLGIILLGACVRPMLPRAVRWYVNRVLSRNLDYEGRIGDVTLNLWRGAYSISDVRLSQRTGDVPVPLIAIKRLELAVQWNALLHRRLVVRVLFEQPQLNFVAPSDQSEAQTGGDTPWLDVLQQLAPFKINRAEVQDGSIHFRSYVQTKPVDVYLDNLQATVDNLTNIKNQSAPMMATVDAKGMAMDQADFEFHMKLDPSSYRPDFQMAVRLLGLDVTTLNDLSHTYGGFDFKSGFLDLVVEAQASEGQIQGYVKPLFRNLRIFNLGQDVKYDANALQFFWQAILGVTTGVLKNGPRDQFGTYIPFTGDTTAPKTDLLATIGNVLRNAFIRAYLPRFSAGNQSFEDMQFQAPSITGPTSIGEEQ
jgi:hypothetical protein